MRVLVCGGRDFDDYELLKTVLSALQVERGSFDVVIHGAARGADMMADTYARRHLIHTAAFPADWRGNGRAAGVIRNQRMIDEARPELVVAFRGGAGTADLVRRARAAGIEVIEVTQ